MKNVQGHLLVSSYERELGKAVTHALAHGCTDDDANTEVESGDRPRSDRTPAPHAEPERGRTALRSRCRKMRDATSCDIASTAAGGVSGGVGRAFAGRGEPMASGKPSKSSSMGKLLAGIMRGSDEGAIAEVNDGGGVGKPVISGITSGSAWNTCSTRSVSRT